MIRTLRIHWVIWSVLVIIVGAGTIVYFISSSPTIASLELVPDTTIDVSVFRPRPDAMRLSLTFERLPGQERPELGEYSTRGNWRDSGFLEFAKPGLPVTLLVRGEDKEVVYEAMPVSSLNATMMSRDLYPFVDDGNPHRFQWPPDLALRNDLSSGYSKFTITVLDVGDGLKGEKAELVILPPVGFKGVMPGYELIWWFMFWHLYAFLLLVYGAVLLWYSRPKRSMASNAS